MPPQGSILTQIGTGIIINKSNNRYSSHPLWNGYKKILLTTTKDKYHQVKRMLETINNKFIYLKRLRIGNGTLDGLNLGGGKLINTTN